MSVRTGQCSAPQICKIPCSPLGSAVPGQCHCPPSVPCSSRLCDSSDPLKYFHYSDCTFVEELSEDDDDCGCQKPVPSCSHNCLTSCHQPVHMHMSCSGTPNADEWKHFNELKRQWACERNRTRQYQVCKGGKKMHEQQCLSQQKKGGPAADQVCAQVLGIPSQIGCTRPILDPDSWRVVRVMTSAGTLPTQCCESPIPKNLDINFSVQYCGPSGQEFAPEQSFDRYTTSSFFTPNASSYASKSLKTRFDVPYNENEELNGKIFRRQTPFPLGPSIASNRECIEREYLDTTEAPLSGYDLASQLESNKEQSLISSGPMRSSMRTQYSDYPYSISPEDVESHMNSYNSGVTRHTDHYSTVPSSISGYYPEDPSHVSHTSSAGRSRLESSHLSHIPSAGHSRLESSHLSHIPSAGHSRLESSHLSHIPSAGHSRLETSHLSHISSAGHSTPGSNHLSHISGAGHSRLESSHLSHVSGYGHSRRGSGKVHASQSWRGSSPSQMSSSRRASHVSDSSPTESGHSDLYDSSSTNSGDSLHSDSQESITHAINGGSGASKSRHSNETKSRHGSMLSHKQHSTLGSHVGSHRLGTGSVHTSRSQRSEGSHSRRSLESSAHKSLGPTSQNYSEPTRHGSLHTSKSHQSHGSLNSSIGHHSQRTKNHEPSVYTALTKRTRFHSQAAFHDEPSWYTTRTKKKNTEHPTFVGSEPSRYTSHTKRTRRHSKESVGDEPSTYTSLTKKSKRSRKVVDDEPSRYTSHTKRTRHHSNGSVADEPSTYTSLTKKSKHSRKVVDDEPSRYTSHTNAKTYHTNKTFHTKPVVYTAYIDTNPFNRTDETNVKSHMEDGRNSDVKSKKLMKALKSKMSNAHTSYTQGSSAYDNDDHGSEYYNGYEDIGSGLSGSNGTYISEVGAPSKKHPQSSIVTVVRLLDRKKSGEFDFPQSQGTKS